MYEEEKIVQVINEYFQDIFITRSSECSEMVAQAIETCISAETNEKLIAAPTASEIRTTLFSIHPDKAPGPDGFPASFFQTNWSVVGKKIIEEIRDINNTHVRVIPKVYSPKMVS